MKNYHFSYCFLIFSWRKTNIIRWAKSQNIKKFWKF